MKKIAFVLFVVIAIVVALGIYKGGNSAANSVSAPAAKNNSGLRGKWYDSHHGFILEITKDRFVLGRDGVSEKDSLGYRVEGSSITVFDANDKETEQESIVYELNGDSLKLLIDGMELNFKRR